MKNIRQENVMEHTCQVCMIAHALVLIQNQRYGAKLNESNAITLALFHEAGEVLTGDLVTPIKYFNPQITQAFQSIEHYASNKICSMLPPDLQNSYRGIIIHAQEQPEWPYVKAADRICAYIKCIEELKGGNGEFEKASQSILKSIKAYKIEAVSDFMQQMIPGFMLALDELN